MNQEDKQMKEAMDNCGYGVGSEVYGAVSQGRKAIGVELKTSYYKQSVKNLDTAMAEQYPLLYEKAK